MHRSLGLIDLSLRCIQAGREFGWREHEILLDLPAQHGLAGVLTALVATDEANLLDL